MSWEGYRVAGFATTSPEGDAWWVLPITDPEQKGWFPFDHPVSFVTAHNPRGSLLDAGQNDARHRALLDVVYERGWAMWPAVGGLPGRTENEAGVLLVDLDPASALALAAQFDQDAIYVWHCDGFDLVACDDGRTERFGWRVDRPDAPRQG